MFLNRARCAVGDGALLCSMRTGVGQLFDGSVVFLSPTLDSEMPLDRNIHSFKGATAKARKKSPYRPNLTTETSSSKFGPT